MKTMIPSRHEQLADRSDGFVLAPGSSAPALTSEDITMPRSFCSLKIPLIMFDTYGLSIDALC
jgi:hypothetical protein